MIQPSMSVPSSLRKALPLDYAPVVLIADKEPVIRELYQEILGGQPVRLLTAADGQEALALAQTWVPELVVTDIAMPRLDGFGLVRALRRLYPDVPVIVITGTAWYRGRPVQEVAAEHGVVTILTKPFNLSDLQDAIQRAVPVLGLVRPMTAGDGIHAA